MKMSAPFRTPTRTHPVRVVACDLGPDSAHVMVDRSLIEQDGRGHVS